LKNNLLFVENQSLDPWFNIAAEEYLLKHFDAEIVMLWRSYPSIVVGKHQNTLGEINFEYVRKNNIPVIRRLSGGGTVFHDPGNINFTFIKKVNKENMIDFKSHVQPVIEFLNEHLQVPAEIGGKNDIRVNGLKISGNAEHIYKDKVLHHGTLLFNSDIEKLNLAIQVAENRFQSKAVKSNRSTVTNISSHIQEAISIEVFAGKFSDYLKEHFSSPDTYSFDVSDKRSINKLVEEKYKTWEWNFGYSPTYSFTKRGRAIEKDVLVELTVRRGQIESAEVHFDGIAENSLAAGLKQIPHNPDSVKEVLSTHGVMNSKEDHWNLLGLFF
jgi:lipoate---protein ligase